MKRLTFAIALVLAMISPALRADTLRTFSISGNTSASNVRGLVVIDTTTGQGLYGYADLTINSSLDAGMHPPFPAPIVLSGGGIITNGGCIIDCMGSYRNEHSLQFGETNDPDGSFSLFMVAPTSLVAYMGGQLCHPGECEGDAYNYASFTVKYPAITFNGNQYPAGSIRDLDFYFGASLTYVSEVTTPEPSTLILLGSGALGLVGVFRRKVSAM